MTSLRFPDVNVWLALLLADHVHRDATKRWWDSDQADIIGFCRFTQISILRLLTTSAAMNGKPLTMQEAWKAYDHFFQDDRVALVPEPEGFEAEFRKYSSSAVSSPKAWADAYIIAFAVRMGGTVVTFDWALKTRNADCVLLG